MIFLNVDVIRTIWQQYGLTENTDKEDFVIALLAHEMEHANQGSKGLEIPRDAAPSLARYFQDAQDRINGGRPSQYDMPERVSHVILESDAMAVGLTACLLHSPSDKALKAVYYMSQNRISPDAFADCVDKIIKNRETPQEAEAAVMAAYMRETKRIYAEKMNLNVDFFIPEAKGFLNATRHPDICRTNKVQPVVFQAGSERK